MQKELRVVKFGTQVLSNGKTEDPRLSKRKIYDIASALAPYAGNIVVVTSGAMLAGVEYLRERGRDVSVPQFSTYCAPGMDELARLQAKKEYAKKCAELAGYGGSRLGQFYQEAFADSGTESFYETLTHHNFSALERDTIKLSLLDMIADKTIPVLNAHDFVSREELMPLNGQNTFDDNDKLAKLVAKLLDATELRFVSTYCVETGTPGQEGSIPIQTIYSDGTTLRYEGGILNYEGFNGGSDFGRGGIKHKIITAVDAAKELQIPVYINAAKDILQHGLDRVEATQVCYQP